MPFVAALAASHAPNILLEPGAEWEEFMMLHYRMAPQAASSKPSLEAQRKLRQDAEKAFAVLRNELESARPDVLIVVANDQFVNFFFNNIPGPISSEKSMRLIPLPVPAARGRCASSASSTNQS